MKTINKNYISQTRILTVFLFLCICVGGIVTYAQNDPELEGNLVTESGSLRETIDTLQKQRLEDEWQARIELSQEFLQNLEDVQGTSKAFRRSEQQYLERRYEHRNNCAKDLRNASKYTKFSTALRCYKADLTLNAEILRKESAYLEQMAGVSESTRSLALTRTKMLADSISALITGINSDVFETLEDLVESKRNLLKNYRIPQWLSVNQMKAEQLSTWIDSLVTRVALVTEEEQETLDATTTSLLLNGITCLDEAQKLLNVTIGIQEPEEAREQLTAAEEEIQSCLPLFTEAGRTSQDEAVIVEEIQEPQLEISRKLRSRLDEYFRIGKQ